MIKGKDILFLSGIRWDFSHQRHQELAALFARFNRVLFVEMALSPANFLKDSKATITHWRDWWKGSREIQSNLFCYTAPPVLPLGRSCATINSLNQRIIYHGVKNAMDLIGMRSPLLWISDPYFSFFSRNHGQIITIYDWIHDNPVSSGSKIDRTYRKLEKEFLGNADIIFTPSRVIYNRYGKNDPRFHLIPHGVNHELFSTGRREVPADLEKIPPPLIGFIGTIGTTVDIGLLEKLVRRKKAWSFIFIGDVKREVKTLSSAPNVYFPGPKNRQELPQYLSSFDAGIIPYRVSPETGTVHPVKTYEYLAAGIPVVSTNLPELETLRGMIELADGDEAFISCLDKVLKKDTPEEHRERTRFARENSWESRIGEIEKIILKALLSG